MNVEDFSLTPQQQDQILAEEITHRVRGGAELLSIDGPTALIRFGRDLGSLELPWIITMWVLNIIASILSFGFWLIVMFVFYPVVHRNSRRMESIVVRPTGQVDVNVHGRTAAYLMKDKARRQAAD